MSLGEFFPFPEEQSRVRAVLAPSQWALGQDLCTKPCKYPLRLLDTVSEAAVTIWGRE